MKEQSDKVLTNSLTDMVATLGVATALTGGSELAGYGTIAHNNNYSLITQNRIILTYLYTSSGIVQTAIDLPVQDALSKGIEIESSQMDAEEIDQLIDYMEETGQFQQLREAMNWSRLYGGAGLVLNTNQDPVKPLKEKSLQSSPIEFYAVDRWQFDNGTPYMGDDPGQIAGGTDQDFFYLHGQKIHETRVLKLTGKQAPWRVRRVLRGWGMSEVERMIKDLNLYLKTQNVLYEILDESKIDVFKIKGLAQKLLHASSTNNITRRIQLANELKSYINALVMDVEDDYEQKTMAFGGLAEVMSENRIGIASALRMPVTKLFGLSPSGFNTGESDLENYNMMVESEIRTPMKPALRKMIEINMLHLFGRVAPFQIKFPTLRVLTAEQEEAVKDSKFNRAISAYEHGLIGSEEWGQIMVNEDIFTIEIKASEGLLPDQPEPPAPAAQEDNSFGSSTGAVKKNAAGFEESKHPRDTSGQFGAGGGGSVSSVSDIKDKYKDQAKMFITESKGSDTIRLEKIIVTDKNKGVGTKFMEDLISMSDKSGKTISLTPSSDFGGNKKRLQEFYKRFGFVDNKGKNKDYEISDTMYRLPK